MFKIREQLAKQLQRPTSGFWGFVIEQFLKGNRPVQECAVQALGIHRDHNVLELGFGFGYGLTYVLNNGLREGRGVLYGVDYSSKACEKVSKLLKQDIAIEKVKILNEDVSNMSLKQSSIDRVFHTNCYHFWPNRCDTSKEILRVMKPGALMITGVAMERLRDADKKGLISLEITDPEKYMESLETAGFENVRMEDVAHKSGMNDVKLIYASKPEAD